MRKAGSRVLCLWAAGCLLCAVWPAASAAQSNRQEVVTAGDLLPEVRYLRAPLADPAAPRIAVGLMRTTLLATQGPERDPFELADPAGAADEYVAAVGVGAVLPLVQLAVWDGGGAVLTVDGRVFARFRIELPRRDDMGQDWYVGGAVEAGWPRVAVRVGVMHRSSHLGDEFAENTGARRIEFGGEQLDGMVAYDAAGLVRIYGGGAWMIRSYLDWEPRLRALRVRDRALLQFGFDREWQPWSDRRVHAFAGADYYSAERTGWHPSFAAAAGIGIRTTRSLRLTVRAFDGTSHMGEFFLTPERYISLELGAKF